MWLYTTIGFFSIVADVRARGAVLVRARDREDLAGFIGRIPRVTETGRVRRGSLPKIVETPRADYPFRASMPIADARAVLAGLVSAIDYPNFKDAVAEQDPVRAHKYMGVWAETRLIQHRT